LVHPVFQSGLQLSLPAVSLPMLLLFPTNSWWLFLFFRPSTRELFSPPGIASYRRDLGAWFENDRFA
jgi:hypothetical protein